MDRERVWVPDTRAVFIPGRMVEFIEDVPVVQPRDGSPKPVITTCDRMYPAEEADKKEVDDNYSLMYLNEATLLSNVKLRYAKGKISHMLQIFWFQLTPILTSKICIHQS